MRDYFMNGEVSPRSTRRGRRWIYAPAVGEGATERVSFSSACTRGRVFDASKVGGVSWLGSARRGAFTNARALPPVASLPELAMGQCVSSAPADAADDDVVDFPAARARAASKTRTSAATLRKRAGLSPEDPRPHPHPRRGNRPGPVPRTASGGRDGDRRRDGPAPTVDAHRARPARGAAPSSLLEASSRRRARHRARDEKARIYAKLRAFADAMPQRDPSAPIAAPKRDVPTAPAALSAAFEAAVAAADDAWADAPAVADLLAEDVVYRTVDGHRAVGKAETIAKMNEAVVKLARRLHRSASSGGGGGGGGARAPRVKSEGPRLEAEGAWVMTHVFTMMLMKVKVREEFMLDERGKIRALTRIRV